MNLKPIHFLGFLEIKFLELFMKILCNFHIFMYDTNEKKKKNYFVSHI